MCHDCFKEVIKLALVTLEGEDKLEMQNGRFIPVQSNSNASKISLRCIDDLVYTFDPHTDEKEFPTMDELQAFRELHKGAVYEFNNERYLVTSLDVHSKTDQRKATGVKFDHDFFTEPIQDTSLTLVKEINQKSFHQTSCHFGNVILDQRIIGFKICSMMIKRGQVIWGQQMFSDPKISWGLDAYQNEDGVIDYLSKLYNKYFSEEKDAPFCEDLVKKMPTESTWIKLPKEIMSLAIFSNSPKEIGPFVLGSEVFNGMCHALLNSAKKLTMCGDADLTIYNEREIFIPWDPYDGPGSRYPYGGPGARYICYYDLYNEGMGFARKVYEKLDEIVEFSKQIVEKCFCREMGLESCPCCAGPIDKGSNLKRDFVLWGLRNLKADEPIPMELRSQLATD